MTHTHTIDDLLAETDWLRGLARQLVRSNDRAEDIFQQTVFEAIRDRNQVRGALRPWLSTVAKNVASRFRTSDERRTRREARVAAREAVTESVVDTVASFATHKKLVDAVGALEEPYHATLLLRYFEDLPPREIAERMNVKVDTVKTRLKRALKMLRERLDSDFGSRASWLAPMSILGRGAPAASTGASTTVLLRVAAALLMLGVGAVAWWGLGGGPAARPPGIAAAGVVADASDDGEDVVPTSENTEREVVEPVEADPETMEVAVVEAGTGDPVGGVEVFRFLRTTMQNIGETEREKLLATGHDEGDLDVFGLLAKHSKSFRVSEAGVARVPLPGDEPTFVAVLTDTFEGMVPLMPSQERLQLQVHPAVRFSVEVVDAIGRPQAGVPVVWRTKNGSIAGGARTVCDAEGKASIRVPMAHMAPTREGEVMVDVPLAEPVRADAPLDGEVGPIRLILPEFGRVDLTVSDSDGGPSQAHGLAELRRIEKHGMRPVVARAVLKNGTASFPRIGLHSEWQLVVTIDGREEFDQPVSGPERADVPAIVELRRSEAPSEGLVVAGIVVDDTGAPLAGMKLLASYVDADGVKQVKGQPQGETDADGKFELRGALRTPHVNLMVTGPQVAIASSVQKFAVGDRDARVVVQRGAGFTMRFDTPDLKFHDLDIRLRNHEDPSKDELCMIHSTDLRRPLKYSRIRPGRYDIEIVLASTNVRVLFVPSVDFAVGDNPTPDALKAIDLSSQLERVSFRVTDENGQPVKDAVVWSHYDGEPGPGRYSREDGTIDFVVLRGLTDVRVTRKGYKEARAERVSGEVAITLLR